VEGGKPCHDQDLRCSTPMEANFYNISRPYMVAADFVRDPLMDCIYACAPNDANGGHIHVDLKTVYSLVLPICAICKSQRAKIVVGRYAPNGKALL
jgi:hypothetical protein